MTKAPRKQAAWAIRQGGLLLFTTLLASCGVWQQREATPVRAAAAPRVLAASVASETVGALSRYGNPEFYDVLGKRYVPLKSARGFRERGIASWYGPDFHGELTSTRESYDMYQMTAAHKLLPLPTWVEVTNLKNGRKVKLRVNDRGPFKDNRVIDLSYAAALALDVVNPGTAFVDVRAIDSPINDETPAAELAGPRAQMYLQVGAFGERANAERLKSHLNPDFGAEVRIFADPPESPRLYKVQLGPIRNVEHADRAAAALEGLGFYEHHFVNN